MKTYIIQFYDDGFWHNLKDDLNFPVEFVTLQSAQKIKKLIASTGKFPEISKFRIKDSKGVLCD